MYSGRLYSAETPRSGLKYRLGMLHVSMTGFFSREIPASSGFFFRAHMAHSIRQLSPVDHSSRGFVWLRSCHVVSETTPERLRVTAQPGTYRTISLCLF